MNGPSPCVKYETVMCVLDIRRQRNKYIHKTPDKLLLMFYRRQGLTGLGGTTLSLLTFLLEKRSRFPPEKVPNWDKIMKYTKIQVNEEVNKLFTRFQAKSTETTGDIVIVLRSRALRHNVGTHQRNEQTRNS